MFMQTVRDEVTAELLQDKSEPQERLIESLVSAEQNRRTEILTAAFELQESLSSRFDGINKADQVGKNANGDIIREEYSDKRLGEIKKTKETLDNLDAKIQDALSKADAEAWKKLKEFVDKNSKKNENN